MSLVRPLFARGSTICLHCQTEKMAADKTGEKSMSFEDQKRYKELFDKLDVNKDGKVEIKELADGLKKMRGVSGKEMQTHAQVSPGTRSHSLTHSTPIPFALYCNVSL